MKNGQKMSVNEYRKKYPNCCYCTHKRAQLFCEARQAFVEHPRLRARFCPMYNPKDY